MSSPSNWIEVRPGDVVHLASGGPPLTIVAIDRGEARCWWFDADGRLNDRGFPLPCLRPGQTVMGRTGAG